MIGPGRFETAEFEMHPWDASEDSGK